MGRFYEIRQNSNYTKPNSIFPKILKSIYKAKERVLEKRASVFLETLLEV